MPQDSLFPEIVEPDLPEPEVLSRGERRQRLIATRIANGEHPLGRKLPLHADAARDRTGDGLRCGTCGWRTLTQHNGKTYPKCYFGLAGWRVSGCESSDVRAWWPACVDYMSRAEF